MSMMWVGIGSAVLGAGTSIIGANKQAKAVGAANDQNAALQEQQNQSAWNAYLLSRGINPGGAKTGELPTNPQAVNSKLPLWATANFKVPGAQMTWRKKGSTPAQGSLVIAPQAASAPSAAPSTSPFTPGQAYPWQLA